MHPAAPVVWVGGPGRAHACTGIRNEKPTAAGKPAKYGLNAIQRQIGMYVTVIDNNGLLAHARSGLSGALLRASGYCNLYTLVLYQ